MYFVTITRPRIREFSSTLGLHRQRALNRLRPLYSNDKIQLHSDKNIIVLVRTFEIYFIPSSTLLTKNKITDPCSNILFYSLAFLNQI